MNGKAGALRRLPKPIAAQRPDHQTRFGSGRDASDEVVFTSGVHRNRRVVDVAAHDGIHDPGVYIRFRARAPRHDWDVALTEAVRAAAGRLEEAS
jgi:hypothetical protein